MLSFAEVPLAAAPVPLTWGTEVLAIGGPFVVGAGIVCEGETTGRICPYLRGQFKFEMVDLYNMQVLHQLTGLGVVETLSRIDTSTG